jgi:hypothetical protein
LNGPRADSAISRRALCADAAQRDVLNRRQALCDESIVAIIFVVVTQFITSFQVFAIIIDDLDLMRRRRLQNLQGWMSQARAGR